MSPLRSPSVVMALPRYTNPLVCLCTWVILISTNCTSVAQFVRRRITSVLTSQAVRPNAAHSVTASVIIICRLSRGCVILSASSAFNIPHRVCDFSWLSTLPTRALSRFPPSLISLEVHRALHSVCIPRKVLHGHEKPHRKDNVEVARAHIRAGGPVPRRSDPSICHRPSERISLGACAVSSLVRTISSSSSIVRPARVDSIIPFS